jgi:hypothetical protein
MRLARGLAAAFALLAVGGCGILSATPTPAPTSPIAGGVVGPMSFTYPSSWSTSTAGAPQKDRTVFGFVTSPPATATQSCGADYVAGGGGCAELVSVPEGTVVLTMSGWTQSACSQDAQAIVSSDVASGWTSQTIGGLAAAYDHAAADLGGFTRTWEIAGPQKGDCTVYEVKAQFGPSATGLASEVDTLMASLRIMTPGP